MMDGITEPPPPPTPDTTVTLPIELVELEIYRYTPPPLPAELPPARPANLWERIRDGFQLPPGNHRLVREERARFADRERYWERIAERARPYLHYIVDEVEARGMPTELALLPIVESAFRPFAYSHGSAAGLWQFIPSTAEYYGLEQNWWYDGRRDIIAATAAALTYLERLNGLFDGNWLLSVAAYNAGEGTVLRAMRRNQQAGRPTDFWSLSLPRETRNYVPRLLALRDIVADPRQYGLTLTPLPNTAQIQVVQLDGQIDLALAAELAGLSVEELYRLNPGFNRWATPPEGPHRLVLPLEHVERFTRALADLPPEKRVQWRRHEIRRGESLISIAKRYRSTVEVIRDINGLEGSLIRAGHTLIVPVASRPDSAYTLSASQRLAALQQRGDGERQRYRVRRGDSFWSISRRFGVGVRELARWNGMAPDDTLRVGQQLVIWSDDGSRNVAAGPVAPLQLVNYTVEPGDSLYAIAQRFRVSVADLRRWNDLPSKGYLQPGQTLRMKVDVTLQSSR
jgi:membrane-bound lytic murein transglycosylase D